MPITLDGTLGVGTPGITLAGGAITANANQLNNAAEDVNAENRIINGDFGVWQRGTSFTASTYGADRWVNSFTGGAVTTQKLDFALGTILGATQPSAYLRQTVSTQTLAAQYANVQQLIEGVRSYAGQTITLLGWARRSSGTGNMVVEGVQTFGTGGSPSAATVGISPTTVTLGSSWAPFAAVITVPSVTGKTLGSNGNDAFGVFLWTSAGSDYNARTNSLGLQTIGVDLWGIHIRVGTWTAADTALYRPRDPGTELALCQRYYRTGSVYGWGYTNVGSLQRVAASHYSTMRGIPAGALTGISVFGGSGGTIEQINSNSIGVTMTAASAGGFGLTATYTADAEL